MATISDKKFGVSSAGSSLIAYYEPDIVNAQDYYPFGMMSRVALRDSAAPYKFGFNGKMNDNEVKGGYGLQQDYGMRIYDPRIGRFLSKDPLQAKFPFYTPYQFAGNKPIWAVDLDGREDYIYNLVTAKNSDGKPVLALQFVQKRDYNPIIRKVAELNDIPTTYYVMYNGEQVGTYSSEQEMKSGIHGKTVDQLRKIENDRMFRNMLGGAILHAHESLKASERTAGARGATEESRSITTLAEEERVPVNPVEPPSKFMSKTIIVDENLSPTIAPKLEAEGYKTKIFPKGTLDPDIIAWAKANNGVVLTNNIQDFLQKGIITLEVPNHLKSTSQVPLLISRINTINFNIECHGPVYGPNSNINLEKDASLQIDYNIINKRK